MKEEDDDDEEKVLRTFKLLNFYLKFAPQENVNSNRASYQKRNKHAEKEQQN